MARWILIAVAFCGFLAAWFTHSPGMLALGLLVGFGGAFGAVLALASERIAANSRPESAMASSEDLVALSARSHAPDDVGDDDPPPR
jgi:hypothetical protein